VCSSDLHVRGAFTGATDNKVGLFEHAHQGTLFLDEIGELPLELQAKLLRVLENGEYQRVGETQQRFSRARVVAATNRDLRGEIRKGNFRADLYHRLAVFPVRLPALRERPADLFPLVERLLARIGRDLARPRLTIDSSARATLEQLPWPGNVRQLANALERAAILCEGGLITAAHLPISVSRGETSAASPAVPDALPPGGIDLEAVERSYVTAALKQAAGNKSRAARLLGLTRAQLYSRIEKYGL
jgi:two-component system response regulator FlrC